MEEETTTPDGALGLDEGPTPRRIGRHLVIERIGAGAMGVVYAAFDPELSRKLAIKVLRGEGGRGSRVDQAQQRLVREAQALARLSHPNVVQIYDVGTHDGHVYVAMEFVEGQTLRKWLQQQPRPGWAEILATLVPAGRGLAAAHRAELVHRDVKPDNVLIADDGDARVVDFGLARTAAADPIQEGGAAHRDEADAQPSVETQADDDAGSGADEVSRDSLDADMTRTGAILGTPAYMAPEQWAGGAIDARSDQFSFCVVAWEALYGQRPFTAASLPLLGVKVVKGQIDPPPTGTKVPPWLRQELERGLAAEPDARHPSMGTLLDALTRDPVQGRRRAIYGVAGAAIIGASLWIGARVGEDPVAAADPCSAAASALVGVWDEGRRDVVAATLARASPPWLADASAKVSVDLDTWAGEWTAVRRQACEATMVHGEQSAELMDLRIACLDRARVALGALVDVLQDADEGVALRAPQAVAALPTLDECSDVSRLRRRVIDPSDATQLAAVAEVRARLARARALQLAGQFEAAAREMEPLTARAAEVDWAPLVAEVGHRRGDLALRQGDFASAEALLRRAYLEAVAVRHDVVAYRTSVLLVAAIADAGGRHGEARRQWEQAEAELGRAGLGLASEARLHNARFRIEVSMGEFELARKHIETAITLREKAGMLEDTDTAVLWANLGTLQGMVGETEAAAENLERAVAARERLQGAHHPDLGRDLHNLGSLYARYDEHERGMPLLLRGLEIKLAVHGPDHPDVALSHVSLGNVAGFEKDWPEAERHQLEALRILEKVYGPDHREVRYPLIALGQQYTRAGEPARAIAPLRRAIAISEAEFGPDHEETVSARESLAKAEAALE